jgi:hypothetical protein
MAEGLLLCRCRYSLSNILAVLGLKWDLTIRQRTFDEGFQALLPLALMRLYPSAALSRV